ncbi:hypothetical protein ACLOJK_006823, partial [Asimina triloba]
SAAEPFASIDRIAADAIIPDNDNGSGGNSLVGRHVPTGDASNHPDTASDGLSRRDGFEESFTGRTLPLDINVELIEPFRELASSSSIQLQGSLRPSMQRCLT